MSITGLISGNPIAGYVQSLRRRGNLCAPGAQAILTLRTDFPYSVTLADRVVFLENGVDVFSGFITKITKNRPSHEWVIDCQDTYVKALSYFIDEELVTGYLNGEPVLDYEPQSSSYWIGILMQMANLDYTITDEGSLIPQGVTLGLRTVAESLTDILAFSSQYAYANPSGVIVIGKAVRNAVRHTLSSLISVEHRRDDEWTRNVVKVYGYPGRGTLREPPIHVQSSVAVDGIVPDRTTVISTPMIQTFSEAQRVADYMLEELGKVSEVVTATVVGNPNIQIGQAVKVVSSALPPANNYSYTDICTSLESDWDKDSGYVMQVTIGERCPRISGWSKTAPVLYAGTTESGVYRSTDGGISWVDYNTGLPSGDKYVKRMGMNSYDEGMAIVNGKLYYSPGGETPLWSSRTLPAPVNTAGDVPAPGYGTLVAVDSLGVPGQFAVLTASSVKSLIPPTSGSKIENEYRSWVYSCTNTGSAPSLWESIELRDTRTSGSGEWNVLGVDLSSTSGYPYVVATTGSGGGGGGGLDGNVKVVDNESSPRIKLWFDQPTFSVKCEDAEDYGVTNWWVDNIQLMPGSGSTYVQIDFLLDIPYGNYNSNVFMYGSTGSGGQYQRCGTYTDANGDAWDRWEIQTSGALVSGTQWRIRHFVYTGTVFTTGEGSVPTQYLNFFFSPFQRTGQDNITQMVWGARCDSYVRGTSPYGNTYWTGFPRPTSAPYPVWSTLSALRIEIG